jgi:peptidoglycan/xylan/chitin deacetylase (PgdA/CDA1 family)
MTFDDGPGEYTNQLLDILKERGVKATFFPSGNMIEGHADALKRAAAEGHVIGNHSYRHSSMVKDGPEAACSYLRQTADLVASLGIPSPTLMRPPYGDIKQSNIDACTGYSYMLWNVDTLDWQNQDANKIMENVQAQTRPGSIILQHDTQPVNLTSVPMVIDWLRAQGYTLVTVPELFNGNVPLDRTICQGLHPDASGDPFAC